VLDELTRLAWSLDPAGIMLDAGLTPDPWQADLLRSRSRNVLLNIHRQGGKSQVTSAVALGEALLVDESLVLLISRTQRESDELYRKVYALYDLLGRPIPALEDQARTLALENGSRIVSLPGSPDNLRAFSAPRLIVVDEASRVDDEMEAAISPMLATVPDGRLVYLSTPFGKRGFFHRAWTDREIGWRRFEVKAHQCPRISAEFLRNERARLGPRMYAQEYECSFEETVDQYFSTDAVTSAFSSNVVPLFPGGLP
jgi:hypothetical protein